MKIEELRIVNHNILRDIKLNLGQSSTSGHDDTNSTIDLLVGVNGTGKSTLLRSLAIIFQCLEQRIMPPFGFEISYRLDGQPDSIFVSNLDAGENTTLLKTHLRFRRGSEDETTVSSVSDEFLPRRIIALTSGSAAGWKLDETKADEDGSNSPLIDLAVSDWILENNLQDWYLSEVPGKSLEIETVEADISQSSRFLFITENLLPYVVLCGLLSDMYNGRRYLKKVLQAVQIEGLRGFSLQLHIDKDQIRQDQRPFITQLWENATYIVQTGTNYLLVYAIDAQDAEIMSSRQTGGIQQSIQPQQLLDDKGDGLAFFNQLLRLIESGGPHGSILRKVDLFLESARTLAHTAFQSNEQKQRASLYLFDWLSDGEQSFLGRLCLLPLLNHTETLVLLDEPEVHFNDYWKRQLIQMISQALQQNGEDLQQGNSHVIMTSHSSITLSDVANTNIWMLERHHDNDSNAIQPALRTLGTDPSDIIVHIFGAESAVGAHSSVYIRQQVEDAERRPQNERLEQLNKLLGQVGPGYWRYLIRREILSLEAPELWNS